MHASLGIGNGKSMWCGVRCSGSAELLALEDGEEDGVLGDAENRFKLMISGFSGVVELIGL